MAGDATVFDEADLNAFADGRLEPARAAALAESLASDRLARSRIDAWKRQNESLRTLFASVLFEPVPVRLHPTTLAAGPSRAPALPPIEERAARGSSAATLAVTAVGVALVGFMAGALATVATDGFGRAAWAGRGTDARSVDAASTLADRAAEAYRATLADTVRAIDFATGDEARLRHWMSRQLSGVTRIPDLRGEGWKLVGGRIVPGRYAPAVLLAYAQGSERLGVYLASEPAASSARTTATADGSGAVRSWSEGGIGTAVVSTEPVRDPRTIVEAAGDAILRQTADTPGTP